MEQKKPDLGKKVPDTYHWKDLSDHAIILVPYIFDEVYFISNE